MFDQRNFHSSATACLWHSLRVIFGLQSAPVKFACSFWLRFKPRFYGRNRSTEVNVELASSNLVEQLVLAEDTSCLSSISPEHAPKETTVGKVSY